ncbi:MAG: hypothetical protein WCG25_04430 [bacterium]
MGFDFHHVLFITCHTKNHRVVVFHHLYCCTVSGFSSSTSLTIFSSSHWSIAGASNHFSFIISSAFLPDFNISSIITFN